MPARRLRATAVLAAAIAVLAVDAVVWLGVDRLHVGRSDFTATYVGAVLLRDGHRGDLYDDSVQAPLHARLIAPDTEGNLPFVNPPAAAVAALPVTAFSLDTAYRLWCLLQIGLVIAAVTVAVRAAPWPPGTEPRLRAAAGAAAAAGIGTFSTWVLGQWDGVTALGLALAYRSFRQRRDAAGGAWLAVGVLLAKPHLGLGLAAWLLGRRSPRALAGAVAATGGLAAVSLAAVGPAGMAGFAHAALDSTSRWPLRTLLGFTGLLGSWLGDTASAHAGAAVLSVLALAVCAWLGDAVRRRPERLDVALAGATALSLVAAPHLLGHDLVVLAPAAAWSAAVAARAGASGRALLLWLLVNLAAALDLGNGRPAPPGRLVPWALLLAGGVACAMVLARRRVPAEALAEGRR